MKEKTAKERKVLQVFGYNPMENKENVGANLIAYKNSLKNK